jgi:hypothetical protein
VRLHAYVLAADPAWLERSVLSYYDLVDEIVASYDRSGRGWTGAPVPAATALERLEALDRDGKVRRVGGDYAEAAGTPIECDTAQRREALAEAGRGADWVLQIDTDEVLPRPDRLAVLLSYAQDRGLEAVEWPMRVLFRSLRGGRFLEVCERDGRDRFEYPGPIAVRPGVPLVDARRAEAPFLRPTVRGAGRSLQLARPPAPGETRAELLSSEEAILHYSWAGSAARIRSKVDSWGHSEGRRSRAFYRLRWWPAPYMWRAMRDFHPFARGLWPALKISEVARER